ncbi:hypothetical protein EC973_002200 [Apophysomyces ossiformis]|uniref:Uncharacterized protein n=1 Tax=Apophysomyces ossiformis TaxID=679940 RepID=A0A8H7EV33_9FUNG|nr:hypothetical protein EC973_002200 [Apophysomyces ossiformis]
MPIQVKPTRSTTTTSTAAQRIKQRPAAPSTSYPWLPMYRRRRGVVVARRCQPVVASSPTTAFAMISRKPIM